MGKGREGGCIARRIPRVNYPQEGGTAANTLHLICKEAAKVHLSSSSEHPATAPSQLMSPSQRHVLLSVTTSVAGQLWAGPAG